jgi:hypothetical protein
MADLYREAREALQTATKAVTAIRPSESDVKQACVTLLDCCAALARIIGVPGAVEVEPETGRAGRDDGGRVATGPAAPRDRTSDTTTPTPRSPV